MIARLGAVLAALLWFPLPERAWAADDLFELIRRYPADTCAAHDGQIRIYVSDTDRRTAVIVDRAVDQAVAIFRRDGGYVLVEGHRDTRDPDGFDRRHAEAVAQKLTERGVPQSRIWIAARGDSNRLIDNAAAADAHHNRRVEIHPTAWGTICATDYRRRLAESVRENCVGGPGRSNDWECEVGWTILGGGVPPPGGQWPPHVWQRRAP